MSTKPIAIETPTVRVIKRASCPSVSQKTVIGYHIGIDPDDRLVFRVHSNDMGGFFSNEWIPFDDILEALKDSDVEKPITSVVLGKLFRGKSVNTPAFLLAALKAEGVLRSVEKKQRCHEMGDVEAFLTQAKALQSGKTPSKAATTKKAPAAKAKAAPSPAKGKKKSA